MWSSFLTLLVVFFRDVSTCQQRHHVPIITKNNGSSTENTVTENTVTENTVTVNTVTENTVTVNTVTGNTVTKNTVKANTVTENTVTVKTVTEVEEENRTTPEIDPNGPFSNVTITSDETEEDDDDDSTDAFADIEDDDLLCGDYLVKPQRRVLPAAVIIGTKKGGTRALMEFLNMHPLVRRAKFETHFYDKKFSRGVDWYRDQMPLTTKEQIGLEKTPGYFHTPGVPERIWGTNNKTRLLLIIRNPVRRLVSDYNQFRSNHLARNLTYPPLEDLVLAKTGEVSPSYPPLERSLYWVHLARWLSVFPPDQLFVVDGDRFIKEPWVELQKVEKFLGLSPQLSRDNFFFNVTKGFYCGKQMITNFVSEWSCSRTKCLSKSKGRKDPEVGPNVLTKLAEYFEPENRKFFNLLQRFDFSWR